MFGPRSGTSELSFFRTGPHDCGNRGFPIANDSRLPSENETRAIAQAPRTIATSFRLSFIEIQAAQAVRAAQAARAARAALAARCTRCCIRLRFADDGKIDLAAASGRTSTCGSTCASTCASTSTCPQTRVGKYLRSRKYLCKYVCKYLREHKCLSASTCARANTCTSTCASTCASAGTCPQLLVGKYLSASTCHKDLATPRVLSFTTRTALRIPNSGSQDRELENHAREVNITKPR